MYSEKQLIRLAGMKVLLRQRIALRRSACAEAASRVVKPIEWVDKVCAFVRKISPVALCAALPIGALIQGTSFPRLKAFSFAVRWGPLLFSAVRRVRGAVLGPCVR